MSAPALAVKAVHSALIEIDIILEDHWGIMNTMLEPGFAFSRAQRLRSQRG